jgi:hypothetical protein
MRAPTYTVKLPTSIKDDIQSIADIFGIPSERKTVEACIETVTRLILENKLDRLYPYERESTTDNTSASDTAGKE